MSQIEQEFRLELSKNPEIERCYQLGLINRRSLARYLTKQGIGKSNQLDAVIAMIRRFPFVSHAKENKNHFKDTRINIKDKIVILDFEKEKELLRQLERTIASTNYDRGDTLKIVVGSSSITVFVDDEQKVKSLLDRFKVKNKMKNVSEMSVLFRENITKERGILSTITRELTVHDIPIVELLTASSELLIYVHEESVLKAYEVVKRLQG